MSSPATMARREPFSESSRTAASELRVALLTNIIPPFRRPLFQELGRRCKQFRVFLSTPMESNRDWRVDWAGLDVTVQKTATLTRRIGHNSSSDEQQFVHFPIDTVPALTKFGADVVISSELGFRTCGAILYRLLNRKSRLLTWVCVSESTETQRSSLRHSFRKQLVRGIDCFLVNGDSGARYLQTLGIAAGKIFKAPYPTDVERFGHAELYRDGGADRRLLYAGRLVERKGVVPLLRTLARWAADHPASRIDFDLIGSGPLEPTLRGISKPQNLSVSFRPPMPYDGMSQAYRQAGIFVFPSLADEWGTVVTEAMASGLPVLGSLESQAVEELVKEGVNGWVFRPADEASMYSAIDRCLNTTVQRLNEMRSSASSAALRISPEWVADQVIEAINDCVAAK